MNYPSPLPPFVAPFRRATASLLEHYSAPGGKSSPTRGEGVRGPTSSLWGEPMGWHKIAGLVAAVIGVVLISL